MKLTLVVFICEYTFNIHQVLGYLHKGVGTLKLLSKDTYKAINSNEELWNWLLCATFPCSICSKESKLWITSNKRNKNKLYIVNDYKHGDDDNNNDNYDNQYCVNIMRREFNIREQHHRLRTQWSFKFASRVMVKENHSSYRDSYHNHHWQAEEDNSNRLKFIRDYIDFDSLLDKFVLLEKDTFATGSRSKHVHCQGDYNYSLERISPWIPKRYLGEIRSSLFTRSVKCFGSWYTNGYIEEIYDLCEDMKRSVGVDLHDNIPINNNHENVFWFTTQCNMNNNTERNVIAIVKLLIDDHLILARVSGLAINRNDVDFLSHLFKAFN